MAAMIDSFFYIFYNALSQNFWESAMELIIYERGTSFGFVDFK